LTAGLPEDVGEDKDSARARAVRAVSRDDLGLPGDRVPGSQALLGGPVPDATPWEQIAAVGAGASKVCAPLAREAAPGAWLLHDDPAVRLLALRKAHRPIRAAAPAHGGSTPPARTGRPPTALVVQVGEPPAMLSDSSRRHAGETLQGLLAQRAAGLDQPLARSDALARQAVTEDAAVLRCPCLAQGRRQCSDLEAVLPHACQVVREGLSQVFDHAEQARQEPRSPEARWAYPQAPSPPLLDGLKRGLATPLDEPLGEPTSAVGQALGSRPRPWGSRTRFFAVPGAPRDHHRAARAWKRFMRQRNNTLCDNRTPRASMARVRTRRSAPGL